MLKFIGCGSCFNVWVGNNSAFYLDTETKHLILIDVGGTTYEQLVKKEILKDVEKITILITHKHPDHIGGLGSLIFHCHYLLEGMKPTVIYPNEEEMRSYLRSIAVRDDEYRVYAPKNFLDFSIESYKQRHVELIDAFGYLLVLNGKKIYYSGDTNDIPESIIEKLKSGEIDYMYQEVTRFCNTEHTYIEKLIQKIPMEYRGKVTCMHFDDERLMQEVKEKGFNLPEVYEKAD